jgi:hypothetical protein
MLKNPCVPNPFVDDNRERYQQYRHYVIARLPSLTTLDAEPVSEGERKFVSNKPQAEIPLPSPIPQQVLSSLDVRILFSK